MFKKSLNRAQHAKRKIIILLLFMIVTVIIEVYASWHVIFNLPYTEAPIKFWYLIGAIFWYVIWLPFFVAWVWVGLRRLRNIGFSPWLILSDLTLPLYLMCHIKTVNYILLAIFICFEVLLLFYKSRKQNDSEQKRENVLTVAIIILIIIALPVLFFGLFASRSPQSLKTDMYLQANFAYNEILDLTEIFKYNKEETNVFCFGAYGTIHEYGCAGFSQKFLFRLGRHIPMQDGESCIVLFNNSGLLTAVTLYTPIRNRYGSCYKLKDLVLVPVRNQGQRPYYQLMTQNDLNLPLD